MTAAISMILLPIDHLCNFLSRREALRDVVLLRRVSFAAFCIRFQELLLLLLVVEFKICSAFEDLVIKRGLPDQTLFSRIFFSLNSCLMLQSSNF